MSYAMEEIVEKWERINSVDSLILLATSKVNEDATRKNRQKNHSPSKSLSDEARIYSNLQKAALVCDTMENISVRRELKKLIEDSLKLFRSYHGSENSWHHLTPPSPESPTSSMHPQLGTIEIVPERIVETQTDNEHYMAELSLLSVDSTLSEKNGMKQSCLNLKSLRRLGSQISRILWGVGRHDAVDNVVPQEVLTNAYDAPMSPSLQYFVSQHRAPPPTLPLDQFVYQERCRSTDADCDNDEIRYFSVDDAPNDTPNRDENVFIPAESSTGKYPRNFDMCERQAPVKLISSQPTINMLSTPRSRSSSRAKQILLLETATAIGLSLCKAFLVWRNAMFMYRRFCRENLSEIRSSLEGHAIASKVASDIISPYHIDPSPTQLVASPTFSRPLAITTGLINIDIGCDSSNGYECDSNSGSNCDSNSSSDSCRNTSSRSSSSVRKIDSDIEINADPRDDTSLIDDIAEKETDSVLLHQLFDANRVKGKKSSESRPDSSRGTTYGDNRRGQKRHDRTANLSYLSDCDLNDHPLSADSDTAGARQNKWLSCLNAADAADLQKTEQLLENSPSLSCRFDYVEVFGKEQSRRRRRKGRSRTLVPTCITPVDSSESDSDPDVDLESISNSQSSCCQISPTQFAESNPISKLLRPAKKNRSISFDGGCLPIPLLFDRRKRSQSITQIPVQPLSLKVAPSLTKTRDDGKLSPLTQPLPQPLNFNVDSEKGQDDRTLSDSADTASPYSFQSGFDYMRCAGFGNDSKCNISQPNNIQISDQSRLSNLIRSPNRMIDSPSGSNFRDCFGTPREPLVLHSHVAARQDQYRAIGPVVRSNELAMWAIFAQYPMTCCDVNLEMSASALAVHNYSSSRPLLSFACLRSLLSSFGVCPAICSESELLEHLKEMKVATSPPSSPFFTASPIKVCSFESFVKILWLVASERMLMTVAAALEGESSDTQAQVRFAMLLHQMDISEGRAKLTQCLMNSSNRCNVSLDQEECLSPLSPVSKTFKEPLLPLPAFDLSVLREARGGMPLRKMMVTETASRMKIKKKMVVKSAVEDKTARFSREVTSGIATENSSEDLSDF